MRSFINGMVFTVFLLLGAGFGAVWTGLIPAGADAPPWPLERWAADRSLHATIDRATKGLVDPLPSNDATLLAGAKLYGTHCALCHGASDGKTSAIAQNFSVKAPQFARDGVEDDPESATYWKVKHGIRFTAMPAFGPTLSDEQIWQLSAFLAKLDKLPPAVDAIWKKLPSAAP